MTVSNLTRCQTILAIAACLFAALAFASCGDQEGSRPADTESTDAGKAAEDTAWKTAYRQILETNQADIESYEYQEYEEARGATALCDLNDDGTPELLFFLPEVFEGFVSTAEMYIYTFRDGKATELDYGFPEGRLQESDAANRLTDVNAASGTSYAVYKSKSPATFGICRAISDESGDVISCEYTASSGSFDLDCWEDGWQLDYETDPANPTEKHTWYHRTETISKEDFDKSQRRLAGNMDQLLFFVTRGHESAVFDKAAGMEPQSVFCSDMIDELTVTESTSAGSGSGDADGGDVLGGLEDKQFAFSSGAGGWGTTLTFGAGGSFRGKYHDSNLGETGADYPNGTEYRCVFDGVFSDPKATDDREYTLTLKEFNIGRSSGETIRDGVLIKYSDPYGMEDLAPGDTVRLLLPGYPLSKLNEEQRSWTTMAEDGDVLKGYCLVNDKSDHVFCTGPE
ncbi:MAG: hypothetical protein IJI20_00805 [Firmicutes bacterium]|nr:hypothetical protein [Bacillota bacterium]